MSDADDLRDGLAELVRGEADVARADGLRGLCESVVGLALRMVRAEGVGALLLDEEGRQVELSASSGSFRGPRPGVLTDPAACGLAGEALRLRCAVSGPEDGHHGVAVPLECAGEVKGALHAQRPAPFGEAAPLLLQALAAQASLAAQGLHARDELSREKASLEAILECSADAIITTDQRGRITFFSRGAEELFGYSASAVVGTKVSDYYLGGEKEARRVQRYVEEEGKVRNYEAWFKVASGEPLPTSLSASVLRDRTGHVLGTLGILKDITVEKRLERKLSYTIEMLQEANENLGRLAVTDSLSGLRNQRFFHRKLEEELLRAVRTRRPLSLLLVDIDKFKRFNDNFGHQVGDRVIQEMGATVAQSIRKIDHGCRYGGEEFTVILPDTPLESALVVARRIQKTFAASPAWAELGLEPPTLSMGLAAFIAGDEADASSDALIKRADDAMYRVKRRGGNDVESS